MHARHYDSTIEHMVTHFCKQIAEEVEDAARSQKKKITVESLVDRHGKKKPGFIDFDEFCEIYKIHVHFADENNMMRPMPAENKLRGLFNTLDPDQRSRISRHDFGEIIR